MAQIIWTSEARRNLDAIDDYYFTQQLSSDAATALIDRLVASMDRVAEFPDMGRAVPEFAREDVRELVREEYRIVYNIVGDRVFVAAVLHGTVDIASRLGDRFGRR